VSVRIGLGISGFPFSGPDSFWRWVDLCEDSVVDSLWFSERLVSAQPQLEPMTVFGALAGRTQRIKFGMNAIVLPLRDPLVLAKECATVDFLSSGRLLPAFGVGGEKAPEFRATGRDPVGRGSTADEMLEIMSRLWTEDNVTYQGKHFRYESVTISPKPVQRPLPMWIGGSSTAAIRRTARLGTGWLAGIQSPSQVRPVIQSIKREAASLGRSIDDDHYGAGFPFRFGHLEEPVVQRTAVALSRIGEGLEVSQYLAVGSAEEIVARAREYVDAGISKFVLRPIAGSDEEMLEQTRQLIDEVLPIVHAFQAQ
jgi:probable F420-dependent oxidoreductase